MGNCAADQKVHCQQVCIVAAENTKLKRAGLGTAVEVAWHIGEAVHARVRNAERMDESLLNQELIKAAREGRDADVSWCLEHGAFVETRRPFTIAFHIGPFEDEGEEENDFEVGLTPLMHAALGGYAKTCRVLLSAGANVNSRDEDRMQPLHFAAKSGNLEVFTLLLQAKADPWARDSSGRSALHYLSPDEHTHANYHAHPALKAVLSVIAATPPPGDEVDSEKDACSIAEELLELPQASIEASSFCGNAGSYREQDLEHSFNAPYRTSLSALNHKLSFQQCRA